MSKRRSHDRLIKGLINLTSWLFLRTSSAQHIFRTSPESALCHFPIARRVFRGWRAGLVFAQSNNAFNLHIFHTAQSASYPSTSFPAIQIRNDRDRQVTSDAAESPLMIRTLLNFLNLLGYRNSFLISHFLTCPIVSSIYYVLHNVRLLKSTLSLLYWLY